ncbi:MAG: histidine kinase [Cyclobacteriaceae bacterium]
MAKIEKFLPYLLSFLLPGLNVLSNSPFTKTFDLVEKLPKWALVFTFLLLLWHINQYLLNHKPAAFLARLSPTGRLVLTNIVYILAFTAVDYFLLPEVLSLTYEMPFWTILLRLSMATIIFGVIQFGLHTQKERDTLKISNLSLQSESLQAQLEMFKQQINPHFLFNSLNTLIDLIEEDHVEAVEFVRHFSNLYRFVLQSSKKDLILVRDEIDFLDAYWKLLKMRHGAGVELSIHLSEQTLEKLIPPLSLQLLLENAVKYNKISTAHPLQICISDYEDTVKVRNTLMPKEFQDKREGLGLKNLRHRYQFILGKPITIDTDQHIFTVILPIIKEYYYAFSTENSHY